MTMRKDDHVRQYAVGGFDQNFSYVIWNHAEQSVAVVDPAGDVAALINDIRDSNYAVEFILLTHSHEDHWQEFAKILSLSVKTYMPKIIAHRDFLSSDISCLDTFTPVEDGHVVHLGSQNIRVLATPGHTCDAVCFFLAAGHSPDGRGKIFSGDTLFVEGCGRTSLEEAPSLFDSLMRLKTLPENTIVYAGHDYGSVPHSTIAHEKVHNRFICADSLDTFLLERFPQ